MWGISFHKILEIQQQKKTFFFLNLYFLSDNFNLWVSCVFYCFIVKYFLTFYYFDHYFLYYIFVSMYTSSINLTTSVPMRNPFSKWINCFNMWFVASTAACLAGLQSTQYREQGPALRPLPAFVLRLWFGPRCLRPHSSPISEARHCCHPLKPEEKWW